MSLMGDAMMAVGVLMMLFAFMIGYAAYNGMSQGSAATGTVNSVPTGTVNASVSNLTNNIASTLNSESLLVVKIVLLFLFANIGYKFVYLGLKANAKPAAAGIDGKEKL